MAYQNIHKNDYQSSAYLVFIEGAASLSTSDILTPLPAFIPGLETDPLLSAPLAPSPAAGAISSPMGAGQGGVSMSPAPAKYGGGV